jgi:hypothetical protein
MKITLGKYKTRDGQNAFVSRRSGNLAFPWSGNIEDDTGYSSWTEDGNFFPNQQNQKDLVERIGDLDEPATVDPSAGVNLRQQEHDTVNRPKHYTNHPSGIECIQITEHMGFNLGNALKYIWRCDLKQDAVEDLKKAVWYINREIEKRCKKTPHNESSKTGPA